MRQVSDGERTVIFPKCSTGDSGFLSHKERGREREKGKKKRKKKRKKGIEYKNEVQS